jgi:hypothetical protein
MSGDARSGFFDFVYRLSALVLALLLALRVVRYLPLSLPEALDAGLGQALVASWLLFIFPLLLLPKHLAVLGALSAVFLFRPSFFIAREGGKWLLRPWAHALLWLECSLNHYLFDVSPYLAILIVLGFVALERRRLRGSAGRNARLLDAGVVLALVLLFAFSDTWADAAAIVLFALFLGAILGPGSRVFGSRERRLLVLAGGVSCQLLASGLPIALPLHGGTELGRGMAYSFCEAQNRRSLYAAVPDAPTMVPWSLGKPHGIDGYVAEYRTPELSPVAQHRFFSDEFYGRLEWLLCLDDTVQVGMTNVYFRGRRDQDHAMEFSISDPRSFVPDLLQGGVGHGIAYDERRDVLYYVSESKPTILRYVRSTGEREVVAAEGLQDKPFLSLIVGPRSIHRRRDSLFLTEWFNGTVAYELDLETRKIVRRFPHRDGGALGITVDEDLDRLWVVGVWGMEVFDLETGRLLGRRRLGLLSRSPAIDREHDIVYVPSTTEGKIRLFDRRTLELLGVLPIGHGPRIPYYSDTQQRLFSSSSAAHFFWDGAALSWRFRRAR